MIKLRHIFKRKLFNTHTCYGLTRLVNLKPRDRFSLRSTAISFSHISEYNMLLIDE